MVLNAVPRTYMNPKAGDRSFYVTSYSSPTQCCIRAFHLQLTFITVHVPYITSMWLRIGIHIYMVGTVTQFEPGVACDICALYQPSLWKAYALSPPTRCATICGHAGCSQQKLIKKVPDDHLCWRHFIRMSEQKLKKTIKCQMITSDDAVYLTRESPLVQLLVSFPTAPKCYLSQCWLIIKGVLWCLWICWLLIKCCL